MYLQYNGNSTQVSHLSAFQDCGRFNLNDIVTYLDIVRELRVNWIVISEIALSKPVLDYGQLTPRSNETVEWNFFYNKYVWKCPQNISEVIEEAIVTRTFSVVTTSDLHFCLTSIRLIDCSTSTSGDGTACFVFGFHEITQWGCSFIIAYYEEHPSKPKPLALIEDTPTSFK